jgi:hypothetical protein
MVSNVKYLIAQMCLCMIQYHVCSCILLWLMWCSTNFTGLTCSQFCFNFDGSGDHASKFIVSVFTHISVWLCEGSVLTKLVRRC